jgi:two-component system sensor histidine kinase UhpB
MAHDDSKTANQRRDVRRAPRGDALIRVRERLSAVLRAMSEPAWIKDPHGVYLVLNPAAAASIGLSESEVSGKTDYELFPDEQAQLLREGDRDAIASGYSERIVEVFGSRQGAGADQALHIINTPVFDASGDLVGVFGIAQAFGSSTLADGATELSSAPQRFPGAGARPAYAADAELQRLRRQIDAIVMRQQSVHEEERKALSIELHDQLGQAVSRLTSLLNSALGSAAGTAAEQPLSSAMEVVAALSATIRDLSGRLRPPELDALGLAAAIRAQVGRWSSDAKPKIGFSDNIAQDRFAPELELGCFRVVQEALSNALQHADARSIEISLARRGHHLWLSVQDDGRGFDVGAAIDGSGVSQALGVLGMRDRVHALGGDFDIDARPGAGTRLLASFPLLQKKDSEVHAD